MIEAQFTAPKRTTYSRFKDGSLRGDWKRDRALSASRECLNCGAVFRPVRPNGRIVKECMWKRQRFCSISCSKKLENATRDPEVIARMTATLRKIGHQPKVRGGNGRGMTQAQAALIAVLGEDWEDELAVPTRKGKWSGYPGHYKIDIANRKLRIAIEVDGGSHSGKRLLLDAKKDALLRSQGWSVYRVSNSRALLLSTICKSQDILAILQTD